MRIIDEVATARQPDLPTGPLGMISPARSGSQNRPYFTRVRDVRCGSPRDQAVFACLGTYANPETDACWPALSTLCADTRYSLRSVLRALRSLERDGHISRQRSRGGRGTAGQAVTTRYRLRLIPTLAGCHPQQGQDATPSTGRMPPLALAGCRTKSNSKESTEESRERAPRARTREDHLLHRVTNDKPSLSHTPSSGSATTNTCPACERSWPSRYGDTCFDCNTSIAVIQRRLDEVERPEEEQVRLDEFERIAAQWRGKRECKPTETIANPQSFDEMLADLDLSPEQAARMVQR